MTDEIDELQNRPEHHEGPMEGVIAAPAPASVDDPVYVWVVGEEDREYREGPCAWMPRGATLPSEDDACALEYTNSETPLVVVWWPGEWPRRA